jgi:hypothetical protein
MEYLSVRAEMQIRELIKDIAAGFDYKAYDMTVQVYNANAYIPVAKNCFAFMFTNIGDTLATVKGMVVFPSATPLTALGDSRSISGHKLDVYTGTMDLSFRLPILVTPAVEIVQLFYT